MNKFFVLLVCVACLFSCNKKATVEESTSRFMVVHASPNTPDVEVFVDDRPIILQPLQFTSNIFYRDILSGIRNFKVVISGNTYIDTNINFEQNDTRSFFLYDKPIDLKLKIIEDDLRSVANGLCRVRFLQMIPDASKIDLINSINDSTVFSNTDLGEHQDFINIPSGIYNWKLQNTADQSEIYTDWRPDTLLAGKNYTIMSHGFQSTMTNDTLGVWILSNGDFLPLD